MTTTERIVEQGQALVQAIEALETIEPTGLVERTQTWFPLQAYVGRITIVNCRVAPSQILCLASAHRRLS